MKGNIRYWLRSLGDFFLPRACVVCGRRLILEEDHICRDCLEDMPRTYNWNMAHNTMADKYNDKIQRDLLKRDPLGREDYQYAVALLFYRADYKAITKALKYHANIPLGRHFASMLASVISTSALYSDLDLIVSVPLHWTRKLSRGYNQAEIIARTLSKELNVRYEEKLLFRRRHTRTQTKLDYSHRAANVEGAFGVRVKSLKDCSQVKHVLIVDDVFTTGATIAACESALRETLGPSVRLSAASLGFVHFS